MLSPSLQMYCQGLLLETGPLSLYGQKDAPRIQTGLSAELISFSWKQNIPAFKRGPYCRTRPRLFQSTMVLRGETRTDKDFAGFQEVCAC